MQRLWAMLWGTVLVALVLGARCFIPGTSSEISDLLILLGLAWMMVLTGEGLMIRANYMKICWLVFLSFPLKGQVLSLPSIDNAARDGETKMVLTLKAGPVKPAALQWDIIVPVEKTLLKESHPVPTVKSSGKTLLCKGNHWVKGQTIYAYRCILAGGVQGLENGDIAELYFRMQNQPGEFKIRVENAKGVSADLIEVKFPDFESKVRVH
jgi:hypothetical protein